MALLNPACVVSIFYLALLIPSIQGNPAFPDLQFPGQMNSTFLKQLLNIESGDKVPEYEILQLRILSDGSADDRSVIWVHLSAFGKKIHLRLQRNDDFNDRVKNAKFFNANLTDASVQLAEVILEDDDPGTPYTDPAHMAAVIINQGPEGKLQMDGVIGDEFLIKPVPMDIDILADFLFDRGFSDESLDRLNTCGKDANNSFGLSSSDTTMSGVHIVYRSTMKTKNSLKVALDDVIRNINSTDDGRHHKRPLHAWPEVLLIVDYDSYAMHESPIQIKRYYVSFFNGVDLRFKTLSDPKISLVLSGILVANSREATPFIKKNIIRNSNLLVGERAMEDLARHMYSVKMQQQNYPEFDVAVLVTKLHICTKKFIFCVPSPIGMAHFMGACNVIHEKESWMGVAIVEDRGGFDGIFTATHEIGHLLGLTHDGERGVFEGVLYHSVCSIEDGYIMNPSLKTGRLFEWSDCSIKQLKNFFSSEKASCLFNQPSNPSKQLEGSELPGAVLSLDEQCRRIWGTQANASDSRVCSTLQCHKPTVSLENLFFMMPVLPPAAEGSSCGEDHHCRFGKCVPKYTTYSQAWNMAPGHNRRESTTKKPPTVSTTKKPPPVRTTKKPPSIEEDCRDKVESICLFLFTNARKGACKSNGILERCCKSRSIFC